jgi:hypothetical protein
MNIPLGPECYQIVLIEQRWAGPDKTQVASKNAPQLRKFVEACPAEKTSNRGQIG